MSYEGYREILCEKGHYRVCNAHYSAEDESCPNCEAATAWTHEVDQTNGEGEPYPLEVDVESVISQCVECGHKAPIEPTRFKVPSEADIKPWCDRCRLEDPRLVHYRGDYMVKQRRSAKCRGYVPPGKAHPFNKSTFCGLPVRSTKATTIADWELATGREWPEAMTHPANEMAQVQDGNGG